MLKRCAVVVAALTFLTGCGTSQTAGQAAAPAANDLVARWWTWASVPEPSNPVTDTDGSLCAERQPDDVWFLAGNFGGVTKRTCALPSGVEVFGPVGNSICLVVDELVEAAMKRCTMDFERLEVSLDGKPVRYTERTSKGAFSLDLTEDNPIVDVPTGRYDAVGVGSWFGPMKLRDGAHKMRILAHSGGWALDVTYVLQVGP